MHRQPWHRHAARSSSWHARNPKGGMKVPAPLAVGPSRCIGVCVGCRDGMGERGGAENRKDDVAWVLGRGWCLQGAYCGVECGGVGGGVMARRQPARTHGMRGRAGRARQPCSSSNAELRCSPRLSAAAPVRCAQHGPLHHNPRLLAPPNAEQPSHRHPPSSQPPQNCAAMPPPQQPQAGAAGELVASLQAELRAAKEENARLTGHGKVRRRRGPGWQRGVGGWRGRGRASAPDHVGCAPCDPGGEG